MVAWAGYVRHGLLVRTKPPKMTQTHPPVAVCCCCCFNSFTKDFLFLEFLLIFCEVSVSNSFSMAQPATLSPGRGTRSPLVFFSGPSQPNLSQMAPSSDMDVRLQVSVGRLPTWEPNFTGRVDGVRCGREGWAIRLPLVARPEIRWSFREGFFSPFRTTPKNRPLPPPPVSKTKKHLIRERCISHKIWHLGEWGHGQGPVGGRVGSKLKS